MIDAAEHVAEKYNGTRESQDEYAWQSQQRTAAAQEAELYKDEIISTTTTKLVKDKESGEISEQEATLEKDEGNRPETNLEGLSSLVPVYGEGKLITAGNASQLSDGSASVVVMESKVAEKKGLTHLGYYRGRAVAGLAHEEMGIGPIYAVHQLMDKDNVSDDDSGLCELHEAVAVQHL